MVLPIPALPIFRSEAQARILAWLLLYPEREAQVGRLTEVADVAQPNVLREVNRLVTSGLLAERRVGRSRLIRANTDSPYFEPLVAILSRAYGPAIIVPEVLREVPGVERVIMIGSWAERYLGKPGPPPRDVDVVVIGETDRRALRRATSDLAERIGLPVQLMPVPEPEWDQSTSGFVETVKLRPYAELKLDGAA